MSFTEDLLHAAMHAQIPIADDLASLQAAVYRRLQQAGWRASLQQSKGPQHPQRADEVLLAAFLAGDGEAFELLAGRHLKRLTGYARRHVPWAVDDVVQETMLVLLQKGAEVLEHPTPNVGAWLFGVLRNKIRKALAVRETELEATGEPSEDLDVAGLLGAHQERAQLVQLIERTCNLREQDVLGLVLDGFKNTEIAAKLALKPSHVGKLKHDGVHKVLAARARGAS